MQLKTYLQTAYNFMIKTLRILCYRNCKASFIFSKYLKNNITFPNFLRINFLMEKSNIIDAVRFQENPGVEKQENEVIIDYREFPREEIGSNLKLW